MRIPSIMLNNYIKILLILVVLALILFYIFINHILNDYGFPWDFLETYFAVPYYWIELTRMGVDVSWIPFQGMGYPLYMNLQSGYYYPFNWFFVFFDIPYTIHSAVLLNILHIYIGSLGILYATRMMEMSWSQSFIAVILYLMYGSFYGNSGHIDMVRAYAITPWLIAPFIGKWKLDSKLFIASLLVLPIVVYFFWTGSYIGIILANLFIIVCIMILRVFILKDSYLAASYLVISLIIGLTISLIFILPTFLESSQFLRSTTKITYDYMAWIDFFALIYPIDNSAFGHDITMRSISIGFIGLVLIVIGLNKFYRINVIIASVLVIAILMATGMLHKYLILVIPQLGLSRFPFADYKGLIGIMLILMAVDSIRYLKNVNLFYVLFVLFVIMLFGNYYLSLSDMTAFNLKFLIFCALFAIFSIYIYKYNKNAGMILILAVSVIDFHRIHSNGRYWNFENSTKYIESTHKVSLINNQLLLNSINDKKRDMRIDEMMHPFKYKGYFNGTYMMNDYGGSMHLKQYENIRSNPILKSYALLEWTPISGNINSIDNNSMNSKVNFVNLESYKTSEIRYSINSIENTSFIENEIYWKGWKGKLIDEKGNIVYEILPENIDGFRKWNVPKGEYTLIANFIPPYEKIAMSLSIVGIFIWLIFIYYIRRKYNDNKLTRI